MTKCKNETQNVILIGMPGVGKSTIGVVLAKNMGYRFLDSDLVIQETEGKLLHELIEENGIEGFLAIEDRINASIEIEKAVIATGGSAVYGAKAMEHFKETGMVVYLYLPYEELAERLGDLHQRGVALRAGQTLQELLEERTPLYEKYAEMTIDCGNKQIREIVAEIADRMDIFANG
ncbi:MAG: shikimate kinase [Lachnospiraceae bacterium]|nr:shikimate kinase [Lachnospiraceae bacterium]